MGPLDNRELPLTIGDFHITLFLRKCAIDTDPADLIGNSEAPEYMVSIVTGVRNVITTPSKIRIEF